MRGMVRKPRTAGCGWSYRLDLGVDSNGKRAQEQVGGFATKKEAQATLNEALTGVQRAAYIAPSRQTLGEFLAIWIEGVRTEVQITALISYRQMVDKYIVPNLGSKRLVELAPNTHQAVARAAPRNWPSAVARLEAGEDGEPLNHMAKTGDLSDP